MRTATPSPTSISPAAPAELVEPFAQLWDLGLQGSLAAMRSGAEALDLWSQWTGAWTEAVLQTAASADAAAPLMCGWTDLCSRAVGIQLRHAGVATPLLSDA